VRMSVRALYYICISLICTAAAVLFVFRNAYNIYICDPMIYLYIYTYRDESNLSSFIFFKRIGHMPFIEQSERLYAYIFSSHLLYTLYYIHVITIIIIIIIIYSSLVACDVNQSFASFWHINCFSHGATHVPTAHKYVVPAIIYDPVIWKRSLSCT